MRAKTAQGGMDLRCLRSWGNSLLHLIDLLLLSNTNSRRVYQHSSRTKVVEDLLDVLAFHVYGSSTR